MAEADTTRHEPPVHPLIGNGFAFVRTAGMRHATEILILELFREVFYHDNFAASLRERRLKPELRNEDLTESFSLKEKAVLYALRGRTRRGRKKDTPGEPFYAPAYPSLAEKGWLRARSDRVIRDFLLAGPIRQHLNGNAAAKQRNRDSVASLLSSAFWGQRAATRGDYRGKEILSVALLETESLCSLEKGKTRILDLIASERGKEGAPCFQAPHDDPLAAAIFNDIVSLCELEHDLSRIQWLAVLQTFLRIALSSWLLAHMRITVYLRDWILRTLEGGEVPGEQAVLDEISKRNLGLFHPTDTPTREVERHVEDYMRSRIEINVILNILDSLTDGALRSNRKELTTTTRGSDRVSISELLLLVSRLRKRFFPQYGAGTTLAPRQMVTRKSEIYGAWGDPLHKGQGKNFNEFLIVLRRSVEDEVDDGYLLTTTRTHSRRVAFRVFPGPLLLQTMTFLADKAKRRMNGSSGRLVLSDLEEKFRQYGIDFSTAAGARPRLIGSLQELGLLKGSPDAGDSAEVGLPYRFQRG